MTTHGGILQGSKLGPIVLIIKISDLPSATNWDPNNQQNLRDDDCDGETFMGRHSYCSWTIPLCPKCVTYQIISRTHVLVIPEKMLKE